MRRSTIAIAFISVKNAVKLNSNESIMDMKRATLIHSNLFKNRLFSIPLGTNMIRILISQIIVCAVIENGWPRQSVLSNIFAIDWREGRDWRGHGGRALK